MNWQADSSNSSGPPSSPPPSPPIQRPPLFYSTAARGGGAIHCEKYNTITINVPLFKKLRDIIFFWWENHFMSHFEGHFAGAKTFLPP